MASSKKLPANKLPANAYDILVDSVKQQLIALLKSHDLVRPKLLVAFSGGLDSTVLLHLLSRLSDAIPFHLAAMHVHHGLSAHADDWAASCEVFCKKLDIPFSVFKVTLDKQSGLGVEAEARKARYDALATAHADVICIGHHQDDQAETLLLQLARGAGVKGLAAMGGVDIQRRLFRPFLAFPRAALLSYAEHHQLTWVEDVSNEDTRFNRNFIRHELLPLLGQRYPNITKCLARTASHMAEASQLLDDLAEMDAHVVLDKTQQFGALNLDALAKLSKNRQKNLIRWWLQHNQLPLPSAAILNQICEQLASIKADANIKIKVSDAKYVMHYQGLAYLVDEPVSNSDYELVWQGEEVIVLPDLSRLFFNKQKGHGIDLAKIAPTSSLIIKKRQGGETIKPDASRPTRTLKQLLQTSHIPPWQRQRLPLIYSGEQLIAVPDIAVDVSLHVSPDKHGFVPHWEC